MCRDRLIISILPCLCLFILLGGATTLHAADPPMKDVLPSSECGSGWTLEDPVRLFTRDTLFDHINGEAELYFPYGFEGLATAVYTYKANGQQAILADVYRMASPLNAFGIYSNYRRADAEEAVAGVEGFISPTQLMYYQDRYFVRLQASGTTRLDKNLLLACGRAISRHLPSGAGRPQELAALKTSGIVPKSERYIAQSLLGYPFFRRGMIADALLDGQRLQIFVVPEDSPDTARKVFDRYRSYLQTPGRDPRPMETPDGILMTAADPLYGNVFVEQFGRYVIGVIRIKNSAEAKSAINELKKRLGAERKD